MRPGRGVTVPEGIPWRDGMDQSVERGADRA
jgi:hypothetical protein